MLKNGETKLTQIAMIKSKITKNNEKIIKDFLPGKSKSEVKAFLETVGLNGERLEACAYVDMKLRLKKRTVENMKRVRELQSKSRHMKPMEDVHDEVYAFWLSHHCPVEKAKRAQAKAERKSSMTPASVNNETQEADCAGTGATKEKKRTRYVKAKVRHPVMAQGHRGCDFTSPDGKRCGSTFKLQFEHVVPFALGGENSIENAKLYCAPHNQYQADLTYGRNFMDEKRQARNAC